MLKAILSCDPGFILFLKECLIYLKGSGTERERERQRDLLSSGSLSKWPQ